VKRKHGARARFRIAEVGEQRIVIQVFELAGGIFARLLFDYGEAVALFVALGLDDADGLSVDE
jgi:hypothetical protein